MRYLTLMNSPKSERARKNRRKIFEAAVSLIEKYGFEQVTMDDIAAAATVARSSVFNHYPSKMDVLAEFFETFTIGVIEKAKRTRQKTFQGRMNALFSAAGKAAHPYRNTLSEVASLALGHGPLAAVDSRADRELTSHILTLIDEAQANGEVRADIKPEFLGAIILALLTSTLHDWVNGAVSRSLDSELSARFEILMSGAAA